MSRVKKGARAHKKRESLLRHTKGFKWGRKSKKRAAKEALLHAWSRAYRGRKEKKRSFRALWNVQINAAGREKGISYSRLMGAMKKKGVRLNRKILSDLAKNDPIVFKKVLAALQ
jgi:large subunit ribosomal protein L20